MTDEEPKPGELVGENKVPRQLLSDMTEEQRQEILRGESLADDIKVFPSPIDGSLSVVAIRRGEEVCQYCFQRFDPTTHEGRATEIYPTDPTTGERGGTRIKVHGYCHDQAGKVVR
jgi:hypothetical protein